MDKSKYLGDSSKADWVADGVALEYDGNMLLTMAPKTVGTVLASSVYVWYGKISATLKTSRGKGVVSAFILLSDMKDEIDYEWVGVELNSAQTNYYWQGVPNCKFPSHFLFHRGGGDCARIKIGTWLTRVVL